MEENESIKKFSSHQKPSQELTMDLTKLLSGDYSLRNKIQLNIKQLIEYLNKLSLINDIQPALKSVFQVQGFPIRNIFIIYMIIYKISKIKETVLSRLFESFDEKGYLLSLLKNLENDNDIDQNALISIFCLFILKIKFNLLFNNLTPFLSQLKNFPFKEAFMKDYTLIHFDNDKIDFNLSYLFDSIYHELLQNTFNIKIYLSDLRFFSTFINKSIISKECSLRASKRNKGKISDDYYKTEKIERFLQNLIEIREINKQQSVFIYGKKDTGKSSFVHHYLTHYDSNSFITIDVDETIDINNLLGGYLVNEFSEIVWQDGVLILALKLGKSVIIRNAEKCGNDLFFILKEIMEKRAVFLNLKQEHVKVNINSKLYFIYNVENSEQKQNNNMMFSYFTENAYVIEFKEYTVNQIVDIILHEKMLLTKVNQKYNLVNRLLEGFESVKAKHKINSSRFRELSIVNLKKFASRIESFLSLNEEDIDSENINLNERFQMKIVSQFLYICFESLDSSEQKHEIYKNEFSSIFNFHSISFLNYIIADFILDENYILDFEDNEVSFEALKENNYNFYCYNSLSKLYLKLINTAVLNNEHILLVGETGVGKTTMIQNLAHILNQKLNVINLSQSSEASDLFGGFRPVQAKVFLQKYFNAVVEIIKKNFNEQSNKKYFEALRKAFRDNNEQYFIKFSIKSLEKIKSKLEEGTIDGLKEKIKEINLVLSELIKLSNSLKSGCCNVFAYVDGLLLETIKRDEWILLDEINLATDELLFKLNPILEGQPIILSEKNELVSYTIGKRFRIFGSMNPEYNIGKKRLPPSLRLKFTEFFVPEISEKHDLKNFVGTYISGIVDDTIISKITEFYLKIKDLQKRSLIQRANSTKANFSLRNLSRALITIRKASGIYSNEFAVSEALRKNFLCQLSDESANLIENEFKNELFKNLKNHMIFKITSAEISQKYYKFENYVFSREFLNDNLIDENISEKFALTPTFKKHLIDILRVITLSEYAVLLEGPTSCGKTFTIEYIAKKIGQKLLRINNNQNTEVEEYMGSYTMDSSGKFYYQEGFLIKAVKEGHWIILDEINLAPSEVLEALNRLLDDNRELYVPEMQKTIKAHKNFKIFAAMNPSETYAGRKDLSDAFKNRFIHIFFDDIPYDDIKSIIEKRCKVHSTYSEIMVNIYRDLQEKRSGDNIFSQKEGLITIRDLLKWGSRDIYKREGLAYEGYFVIAEKLRSEEEKSKVKKIIIKHCEKVCKLLDTEDYFDKYVNERFNVNELKNYICMNKSVKRVFTLVEKCLNNNEPVLLIGDTGTGKTIFCQILASLKNISLKIINCHENMDVSDFIGSMRSVMGKEQRMVEIVNYVKSLITSNFESDLDLKTEKEKTKVKKYFEVFNEISNLMRIDTNLQLDLKKVYKISNFFLNKLRKNEKVKELIECIKKSVEEVNKFFEWQDGPITECMRKGEMILIDEIALTQDSVLERMNSIFEDSRILVLSEKNSDNIETIIPNSNFKILATMNPAGDHGKKELSPALRSRFTEIWIDFSYDVEMFNQLGIEINDRYRNEKGFSEENLKENDFYKLISFKVSKINNILNAHLLEVITNAIFIYFVWFNNYFVLNVNMISKLLTLRDVDLIIDLIEAKLQNCVEEKDLLDLFYHGIQMAVIDGVFLNESVNEDNFNKMKDSLNSFLFYLIKYFSVKLYNHVHIVQIDNSHLKDDHHSFGIEPFLMNKFKLEEDKRINFVFNTQTMKENITKIFRGLSIKRPILVEGSPGVGKTTLLSNLAKKLGKNIVRINLSENTDMIDLIGSEYPSMSKSTKSLRFKWIDGAFLKALKNGDWVIIDEMNLASQSILEGLNSVLDHRKTLYVNELNLSFKCHEEFRIFATQNPVIQGGGRKFLPKSFINRFVKIYLSDLNKDDYIEILSKLYKNLHTEFIMNLVEFNFFCQKIVSHMRISINEIGEYNLRTMMKVCEYLNDKSDHFYKHSINIVDLLYLKRIRNREVYHKVKAEFHKKFYQENLNSHNFYNDHNIYIDYNSININQSLLKRKNGFASLERDFINVYNKNRRFFNTFSICIENSFPMIVTGDTGVGKKEIIRELAYLTNNKVVEVSLNSSIDTTELLGNFDKINLNYHIKSIQEDLSTLKEKLLNSSQFVEETFQNLNSLDFSISNELNKENQQQILNYINHLNNHLNSINVDSFDQDTSEIICLLKEKIENIQNTQELIFNNIFSFEWHDSLLIKAIEKGFWIILDNVNCCPASLLDRLNSLLDDDKSIYLNECGLINNKERHIIPHKDFRIFMVMNPKFGEVSRALKNRCVELHVPSSYKVNVKMYNRIDFNSISDHFFSPVIDFEKSNQFYFNFDFSSKSFQNPNFTLKIDCEIKHYVIEDMIRFSDIFLTESYQNKLKIVFLFIIYNIIFSNEIHEKEVSMKHSINLRRFINYVKCIEYHLNLAQSLLSAIVNTHQIIYNDDNCLVNLVSKSSFIEEILNCMTKAFNKLDIITSSLINNIYSLVHNFTFDKSLDKHNFIEIHDSLSNNCRITTRIFESMIEVCKYYESVDHDLNRLIKNSLKEVNNGKMKPLLKKKRENNKSNKDIIINLKELLLGNNKSMSLLPDFIINLFKNDCSFEFNEYLNVYTYNKEIIMRNLELVKMNTFIIYLLSIYKEDPKKLKNVSEIVENDKDLYEVLQYVINNLSHPKEAYLLHLFSSHVKRNYKNYDVLEKIYSHIKYLIQDSKCFDITNELRSFLQFVELLLKNELDNYFIKNKHFFFEVIHYIFFHKILREGPKSKHLFQEIWKNGLFYQNQLFINEEVHKEFIRLHDYVFLKNLPLSIPLTRDGNRSIPVDQLLLLIFSEDSIYKYQSDILSGKSSYEDSIKSLKVYESTFKAMKINFELKLTQISDNILTPNAVAEMLECGIVTNNINQDNFLPIICRREDFINVEKFVNSLLKFYTNLNMIPQLDDITNSKSCSDFKEEFLRNCFNFKLLPKREDNLNSLMKLKLYDKNVSLSSLRQFIFHLVLNQFELTKEVKNLSYSEFDQSILKGTSDKLIFLPFLYFYLNNLNKSIVLRYIDTYEFLKKKEANLEKSLQYFVDLVLEQLKEEDKIKLTNALVLREDDIVLSNIFACRYEKIKKSAILTQKAYSMLNFLKISSSSLMKIVACEEYSSFLHILKQENFTNLLSELYVGYYQHPYFTDVFEETNLKKLIEKYNKTNQKLEKYSNKKIYRGNNIGSFIKDFNLILEEVDNISRKWLEFLNLDQLGKFLIDDESVDFYVLLKYLREIRCEIKGRKIFIHSFINKYLEFYDDIILIFCNLERIFLLSFEYCIKRIESICVKKYKRLNIQNNDLIMNNNSYIESLLILNSSQSNQMSTFVDLLSYNELWLNSSFSKIKLFNFVPGSMTYASEKLRNNLILFNQIFPADKQENNSLLFLFKEGLLLKENSTFKEYDSILKILLEISQKSIAENEKKEEEKSMNKWNIVTNFNEKIKKYEDLSMKVVDNTKTMDELTKEENDQLKKEEELREIEENFPTYKEEFINFTKIEVMESLQHTRNLKNYFKEKEEAKTKKVDFKKNEIYYKIYKIMSFLLTNEDRKHPTYIKEKIEEFYTKIYEKSIELLKDSCDINHQSTMIITSFYELYSKFFNLKSNNVSDFDENFNLDSISIRSNYYNFYKDGNPTEIKLLFIQLNRILAKEYLEDCIDHPLLILISMIIYNILNFEVSSTPLSKILSVLDILLAKMQEWQKYASKKTHSLEEEMKAMIILIRRYRKIEILTWKGLLNAKLKENEKKDISEYFEFILKIFFEYIDFAGKKEDSLVSTKNDEILETLNLFILNSNVSSYRFRINSLKILSKILSIYAKHNHLIEPHLIFELINSLSNMFFYYKFTLQKFETYINQQTLNIEEKVKNLINIAKWDIKNYFIFKSNMQRNYKQLNKILKTFDGFCLTHIREFITFSSNEFSSKTYVFQIPSTEVIEESKEKAFKYNVYENLCSEMFNRLEHLKSLKKSDTVYKRKALLDLIKTLSELQFEKNYKDREKEVYSQFKRSEFDLSEKTVLFENLTKSSNYIPSILQKFNSLISEFEVSKDINQKYFDAIKGQTLNLMVKSINFLKCCLEMEGTFQSLLKILNYFTKISSLSIIDKSKSFYFNYKLLKIYLLEFCSNISSNLICIKVDPSIKEKVNIVNESMKYVKNNLYQVLRKLIRFNKINNVLVLGEHEKHVLKNILDELRNKIINVSSTLESIESYKIFIYHTKKRIDLVLNKLSELLDDASVQITSKIIEISPASYFSYENIKNRFFFKIGSIEFNNEISRFFNENIIFEDNSEEERKIDESDHKENEKENEKEELTLKKININVMLSKSEELLQYYKDKTDLFFSKVGQALGDQERKHILSTSENFYFDMIRLTSIAKSLLKFAHLSSTIFYNVSVNGFCKDEENKIQSGNEQEEDGKVYEGGFGMSGGEEGVENITKQIEDEEQLLGLKDENDDDKDQEKCEKQGKEEKKKEDAFEVGHDFKEDDLEEKDEEEDEEEEKKENNEDDIERENDEEGIENPENNQLYDKDNEIEEDNKNENNKNRDNVDLTDKNVEMKEKRKDNNYKAKDEKTSNKNNPNNIDKPDENEKTDEKMDEENEGKEKELDNKVEKIEYNDDFSEDEEKKEKEKDKLQENQEEVKMEEEENEDLKDKNNEKEEKTDHEKQGKEEEVNNEKNENYDKNIPEDSEEQKINENENIPDDLFHEKKDNELGMEIDDENKNKEDVDGIEGDKESIGGDSIGGEDAENEEKIDEDIDEDEKLNEKYKSNAIFNKQEDIGYNPQSSKNKGTKGNTSKNTEENKEDQEKEDKNNINIEEELKNLDKYKENFNLSGMLESVWLSKPSMNNNRLSKNDATKNKEENQNENNNENRKEMTNFDFMDVDKNNQQDNQVMEDFDTGYKDNNQETKARGVDENSKNQNKKLNEENKQDSSTIKNEEKIVINDIQNEPENKNERNKKTVLNEKLQFIEEDISSEEVSLEEDNESEMKIPIEEIGIKNKNDLNILYNNNIEIDEINNNNEKCKDDINEHQCMMDFNTWVAENSDKFESSLKLWKDLEFSTNFHINKLTEQLKIALEPNKMTKLKGNYKSGKRLNIKKIISFIASNYRNDKIWLRRKLPFERNYFIMLAIDDSLSMKEHNLGFFALETLVIVASALNKAGIGKLCLGAIKENFEVYHDFNDIYTKEKGIYALSQFNFKYSSFNSYDNSMRNFMKNSLDLLDKQMKMNSSNAKFNQIVFIISDGRFNKSVKLNLKKNVRPYSLEAREKGYLYVFIILDKCGSENQNSILNSLHVYQKIVQGKSEMVVMKYLEDFPYNYYVVLESSSDLPDVVNNILVKWISMLNA